MTRENKIGLLVGLAFIIVVGILISDHISSTNEPTRAALRGAGDTLRSGLGQPSPDDVAPVLRAPQNVTPQGTVVTTEELNHRNTQPPIRFVAPPAGNGGGSGGGSNGNGQAIRPIDPQENRGHATSVAERLREEAERRGEQLIPVGPGMATNGNPPIVDPLPPVNPPVNPPVQPPVVKTAAKNYEAQPGDSLGSIAKAVYGSSAKVYRQAIIAANPELAENQDLIVAGRSYVIPSLQKNGAAPQVKPAVEKPVVTRDTTNARGTTNSRDITYIVKPHDTLWSIATSEVGTASAVAAIRELNADLLNGSDRVRPNMKLTLPKKIAEQ